MQELPHSAILNRDEPREVTVKHFTKQSALLADLANYGSNLVIRAYDSSPKKMAEIVVCGVLLKQVVAMIDATQVLLDAGASHAAFLPARAAWEASVYLDWILFSNSERKATCYIVGNFRDERFWIARVTPGTAEQAAFAAISKSIGANVHANHPNLTMEAATHLTEVNRVLAQPDLQAIDLEFNRVRGRRKRDPEWYELEGVKSIRQIAEQVGRLAEYEAFYSKGSQVTHSGTYKDHVRFANGQVRFKPIRHLESINLLLNFIVCVAVGTYKHVLQSYRPAEVPAFQKKYIEDWREPFQNVQPIKYEF